MSALPQEVVDELVNFVRWSADPTSNAFVAYQKACLLAAKLPPPVDPDVEEARKLLCSHRSSDAGDPPCWQALPGEFAARDCDSQCLRDAKLIAAYFKGRTLQQEESSNG